MKNKERFIISKVLDNKELADKKIKLPVSKCEIKAVIDYLHELKELTDYEYNQIIKRLYS